MRPKDTASAACPDDETLAAFIEQRVVGDALSRLESHVATCATCLDVVAAIVPTTGAERAPAAAGRQGQISTTSFELRAPARVPWRRWAMAAALLLALGGLLAAALQDSIGSRVAPTLARLGTRALGIPLAARAVGLRRGDHPSSLVVTLHEVTIGRSAAMLARADEIAITIALAAPLSGEPVITSVRLARPELTVPQGNPLGLVSSKSERAEVLALLTRASRIEVTDARVVMPGAGGAAVALEGLTGGVQRTAEGASLAFQGQAAGGAVDLVGTLGGEADELLLTVSGRGLDAAALPLLGDHLRGLLDVRVDVTTHGGALRMDGRAAVHGGRLIGRGPGALLRLSPESRAILAGVAPGLAGDDLSFDDARAIFAWRRGTWRLPRVFVTSGRMLAGGRGRVDASGMLSGYGTLRVPVEIVRAVQPYEPFLASFVDANGTATLPFAVGGLVQTPQLSLGKP